VTSPEFIAAFLIALGALLSAGRLLWQRRDWLTGVLAALSLASGLLLYFTLFPPRLPVGGETLVVATAEAPADIRTRRGERLVALPEAPPVRDAERVPDLATALRRYEQVQRVRILGRGLAQRDRDGSAGLPIDFTPMPQPRGLVRLDPPADTAAGSVFTVGGVANGLTGGSAELLDPAGRRVDRRVLGTDGAFAMGGTARTSGLTSFTLRLRGRDGRIVSNTPVPLRTIAQRPVRALLIGAPSPEIKYLRRWAEDSGIELQSRLDAGGGVSLGGERVSVDAATLSRTDVVIVDSHSLAMLGSGSRAALANAVGGGLGLVIRMSAPADAAARSSWRSLGLAVEDGSKVVPVSLPSPPPDADALSARRGLAAGDVPLATNAYDDPVPELGRWMVRTSPAFVAAVRDADGSVLAGWQQRGLGRVALWTVADSFALVLNGQADLYYQWWSDAVSAVSRPDGRFRPDLPALPEAGERIAVCGLAGTATVIAPSGSKVSLVTDPRSGPRRCAAYWPSTPGPHTITEGAGPGTRAFSFLVLPKGALQASTKRELGEATRRWAAEQDAPAARAALERRGPAWPYFLAWLLLSGALWLAERRSLSPAGRLGRPRSSPTSG
jgi:hypothetical protein